MNNTLFRIASLVPSITELLVDLGLASQIVARTGFCIHPREVVANIPKIGGTKDVNLAKLRALAPTHCIVNIDENNRPVVDGIAKFVPNIVVTHPQTPLDNLALFRQLGTLFNCEQQSEALCAQLEAELAKITPQTPEQVLYLIWRDPWMTVATDTYISRMLALINWHSLPNVAGGDGTGAAGGQGRYPIVSLQANETNPWLAQVQRVLLSTEPYSFNQTHVAEVQALLPHAKVQLIDGEMCSWYGSRAIAGVEYLRQYGANGVSR